MLDGVSRSCRGDAGSSRCRAAGIRFSGSQPWFSQLENAQAAPSKLELVLIAVAFDADPVEALELGGFLATPAWARRLERKVDEVLAATKAAARTIG